MLHQEKQIRTSIIMWTKESTLKAFQNKRELTPEEVKNGVRKLFTIKGSGTILDVRDGLGQYVMSADGSGEVLRKKIFNTDYLSPSGFKNPTSQEYLKKGMLAEAEGRKQDAADYYNAFLNAVTMSFSILSNSKHFENLSNGDQINANLQQIETDNGMLVTIDPKSISVKEVSASSLTSINPFEALEFNQETPVVLVDRTVLVERKNVSELMDLA
ncbi:MAG: hypothetical protein IPI46_07950 [Bacteroidetes bacterium]|nr:hypothetical protein [Bacteroidota bacterium]